jgi:hypothetical protein
MDEYYDDRIESHGRGAAGTAETLLLLGALALIAMPAVNSIARRWRVKHPLARGEQAIDKSLKDSFPASDPPGSRYFDIPVNRR